MSIRNNKGFTLIELVIVLAIAALIIAGVLLAVGGAQRTQRDNQRQSNAGQVSSAVQSYASDNDGNIPTSQGQVNTMMTDYANSWRDADTSAADPTYGGSTTLTAPGVMHYENDVVCTATAVPATISSVGATARSYAVWWYSEGAHAQKCVGNQ